MEYRADRRQAAKEAFHIAKDWGARSWVEFWREQNYDQASKRFAADQKRTAARKGSANVG